MRRRIRWAVADLLGRLPGQCRADLVSWALREHWSEPGRHLPWSPVSGTCREDQAVTGTCYCGNLRRDEVS